MDLTGAVVCSAGSTNLGISEWPGVGPSTSDGSSSLARRAASSSGVVKGPGSSLVGLSREATTILSQLRDIKGPYTAEALWLPHRECLSWPLMPLHMPVMPRPKPACFLCHDSEVLGVGGSRGR